uniref:Putative secreted peptide n=1 Tax=Anopheles braziliensis TaxID=58242 RepID=A0A2M3ZNG6_9DIPT
MGQMVRMVGMVGMLMVWMNWVFIVRGRPCRGASGTEKWWCVWKVNRRWWHRLNGGKLRSRRIGSGTGQTCRRYWNGQWLSGGRGKRQAQQWRWRRTYGS